MTTVEKRQKRGQLFKDADAILNAAQTENRSLSAEENLQYDRMIAEMDSLKTEIDREERHAETAAELRANPGATMKPATGEKPGTSAEERNVAFRNYLMNGYEGMTPEQRKLMAEYRALSVGTTTAGGYTVPQGFYDQVQAAMKFFGGIRKSTATIMKTSMGNALPIPTANDTGNTGELVAENTAVSAQDITFGQVTLNAYKFSSKTVLVSFELLQDSGIDIEAFIAQKLGERLGRIQNTYFTTGTGTSQPQGVVVGSTLGKTGTTGQTTSIIYDDLIDMIHSVDPAYRQGGKCHWMMNDMSLKVIRKIKDSQNRPLWQPGMVLGAPDSIFDYPYVVNNDIATMAANAKSVLFGDFSTFFVRDVMDIQLFRIVDKYIEAGQVGFLAYARADSKAVDAGMHPISYYANSAT